MVTQTSPTTTGITSPIGETQGHNIGQSSSKIDLSNSPLQNISAIDLNLTQRTKVIFVDMKGNVLNTVDLTKGQWRLNYNPKNKQCLAINHTTKDFQITGGVNEDKKTGFRAAPTTHENLNKIKDMKNAPSIFKNFLGIDKGNQKELERFFSYLQKIKPEAAPNKPSIASINFKKGINSGKLPTSDISVKTEFKSSGGASIESKHKLKQSFMRKITDEKQNNFIQWSKIENPWNEVESKAPKEKDTEGGGFGTRPTVTVSTGKL